MPNLRERLELIKHESPDAISAILVDCLAHAREDERQLIFQSLLETGTRNAWGTLIRNLEHLDTHVRRALVRANGPIRPAFQHIVARHNIDGTKKAIELVRERLDAELMTDLATLLSSDLPRMPRLAAEAMLAITRHHYGDRGRKKVPRAVAAECDAGAAIALRNWRAHREPDILLVAAILAQDLGPQLAAVINDDDLAVGSILLGVCQQLDHPVVRTNLIDWLANPVLERSAARAIHTVSQPAHFNEVYRYAHLLMKPARRRAMRQVQHGVRCVPDNATMNALEVAVQSRFPSVIVNLGISRNRKIDLVARLSHLNEPLPRLMATATLTSFHERSAAAHLLRAVGDEDPHVAGLAASTLMRRPDDLPRDWLEYLTSSRHEHIRRRANAIAARLDVPSFFERWLDLDRNNRLAAAHRLLARQRPVMISQLEQLLVRGSKDERLGVIYLCRRLGLVADLENNLIELAHDDETRVASASVSALSEGDSQRRIATLRAALEHDDPRVRANAIESLAAASSREGLRLGRPDIPRAVVRTIRPHLDSPENRERANAIRVTAEREHRFGRELLEAMLGDQRALHRVSAIWAAGHVRSLNALDAVAKLAREEEVESIRIRAEDTERRLRSRAS